MIRVTKPFLPILLCGVILGLVACFESPPPTKKEALEALSTFRTTSIAGPFGGGGLFGVMQDEVCTGGFKINRSEIVEIKMAKGSEYDTFPGTSKHLVTLVEEGRCDFIGEKFYLERDFLLVTEGIKGLPQDRSGTWSAWPLEYEYEEKLLQGLDETYDELVEATGVSGWFLILMTATKMDQNDRGVDVWPRNEDHYYFELE